MPRQRTWASKLTALSTFLLSLVLLVRLSDHAVTSSVVLISALALAGMVAAAKVWFHNCFESQLLLSLVTVAALLGTLLSVTLGLPGAPRAALGLGASLVITLTLTSLWLQGVDVRLRRSIREGTPRSSYHS